MPSDQAIKNLGGAVPLRFKQIAVAQSMNEGDSCERLLGLDEDGSVWEYRCRNVQKMRKVPSPQKDAPPIDQRYTEYHYWWQPLRMSAEKGPEHEEPAAPRA